jgi:hypothetical protein
MPTKINLRCKCADGHGYVHQNWPTICSHHEGELPHIRQFAVGTFNLLLLEPTIYTPPHDREFKEAAKQRGQIGGNHISPLAKVIELNGKAIEAWFYRGGHQDCTIELLSRDTLKEFLGVKSGAEVLVTVEEYEKET